MVAPVLVQSMGARGADRVSRRTVVTGYFAATQRSLLGGDGGMLAGLLKTSSDLLERE